MISIAAGRLQTYNPVYMVGLTDPSKRPVEYRPQRGPASILHRRAVLKLALDGAPIDASSERDYVALSRTFEQMQKEGVAPANVRLLCQQVAPDSWRLVLASIFDLIASP